MYDLRKDMAELDKPNMYDIDYIENMLRMYSKTAEDICRRRWKFVKECHAETVLDYGCGCGWFRCWRPKDVKVDSFDINKSALQTGIRRGTYDVLCFFDVLEHLPNFTAIKDLLMKAKYVAVAVPIKPDDIDLRDWYHFKPDEHLQVFTEETIEAIFDGYGFQLIKKGMPECPPRKDIWSFLFRKD